MALTRAQMLAIIAGGGSVMIGDSVYSSAQLLPTDTAISNTLNNSSPSVGGGLPISGTLNATTVGAPLSAVSVPCKEIIIFASEAQADTLIGDANSQTSRIPSLPLRIPVKDVNKVWGKVSTGTGDITWIAIA